jgi:glycosyl transferase, family 25
VKRPEETVAWATEAAPAVAAIPIYVISLDRSPQRREHMREQMAQRGLSYEFIQAVDGRQPIEDLNHLYDGQRRLKVYGTDLTPTEIACCLSHLKACRRILDSKEQIGLVLEDDVILSAEVAPVLADLALMERNFDIIRLAGLRERKSKVVRRLSNGPALARLSKGPCGAQAYVITSAGARKLIAYCTPIVQQIDIAMDETFFNGLDTYAVLPYPVRVEPGIQSTIIDRAADDARRDPAGLYQIARRTLRRNVGHLYNFFRLHLSRSTLGGIQSDAPERAAKTAVPPVARPVLPSPVSAHVEQLHGHQQGRPPGSLISEVRVRRPTDRLGEDRGRDGVNRVAAPQQPAEQELAGTAP